jgi:hypothetical protein
MSKNKRMIYIWDENVEFYDSLTNKSDFINRRISESRDIVLSEVDFRDKQDAWKKDQNEQPKLEGLDDPAHPDYHPDPRIRDIRKQLSAMDARDKENVRKSRQ